MEDFPLTRYKFDLQQFVTNVEDFQHEIDAELDVNTPENVNLCGLNWDRVDDTISTKKCDLSPTADTRRKVLAAVAENYDPFLFQGSVMNRAKLFLHSLQCDKSLGWDTKLQPDRMREWTNIVKQVNMCQSIPIKRYVGDRNDHYKLICFTDASKLMYGSVIYIQSLTTKTVSFIMATNHVVGTKLQGKSIPCLELQAAVCGLETLVDVYRELTNPKLFNRVNIDELNVYCDSMVVLNWIDSFSNKLDKSQNKLNIFVRNRLDKIDKICESQKVDFLFVAGEENPADFTSRLVSYKILIKSNFYTGPAFLSQETYPVMKVEVPCQKLRLCVNVINSKFKDSANHLIPVDRFSSFSKLVRVFRTVLKAVCVFKSKISSTEVINSNFFTKARNEIIRRDQHIHFAECFSYFAQDKSTVRNMPNLVKQLNLYVDSKGILRVRSKFNRQYSKRIVEPILLSKVSFLTKSIILDLHSRMNHSGKYVLLTELRFQFYVPNYFSIVKNILKKCTVCQRFNGRQVMLNQSPYRDMRLNPPSIPFRYLYLDHLGPINVKITFMRAFQMHVHEFGMPSQIISDSGTSLVAGANIIKDFLKDHHTLNYLKEHGIEELNFTQYYKGNSAQGSLVESAVKLTKKLLFGSIRKNVLSYLDFEFVVSEIVNIVNKRPVALKESLRDNTVDDVPSPITPELLIRGYRLPTVNCIPELQAEDKDDIDWSDSVGTIRNNFQKLQKVRQELCKVYEQEFERNLFEHAVDKKDRYALKKHNTINKGDVVLLKEKFVKPKDYVLAIVIDTVTNVLGETTGVTVRKGVSREIVNRHVNSVVPLLQLNGENSNPVNKENLLVPHDDEPIPRVKKKRKALMKAKLLIAEQNRKDLV